MNLQRYRECLDDLLVDLPDEQRRIVIESTFRNMVKELVKQGEAHLADEILKQLNP